MEMTANQQQEHRISLPVVKFNRRKENSKLKGPIKVIRLCLLSILLPGILIAGPLYLRYRVYSEQIYPLGMSDMRLVDGKISTTWCQRQLVKSNATFSAYLLSEQPKVKPDPTHVSVIRHLDLDDDMKEYWGFYLLKGSSVTVSTCSRWPGASLIVIRGHNHLRECAYIGDDSSEEQDELNEIEKENKEKNKKNQTNTKTDDGVSNEPWLMKRARPSVVFHGSQQENLSTHKLSKETENNDNDHFTGPFPLKPLNDQKNKKKENTHKLMRIRNTEGKNKQTVNIDKESSHDDDDEKSLPDSINGRFSSENSKGNNYEDEVNKILSSDKNMLRLLKEKLKVEVNDEKKEEDGLYNENLDDKRKKREITLMSLHEDLTKNDEGSDQAKEDDILSAEDIRGSINGTTLNDRSNSEFWSSFSSSEERLLSCSGLILNLPLTPHKGCDANKSEETRAQASLTNKLTYKVPSNGYYFFVFSSENEIQPNFIRVHFQLEKILYNVSNPVASCTNTTESCSLPLNFFSKEKVVLELPVSPNSTLWNQEYYIVSTCEPRTMIYAVCVVAVPILILLFAF